MYEENNKKDEELQGMKERIPMINERKKQLSESPPPLPPQPPPPTLPPPPPLPPSATTIRGKAKAGKKNKD